MEGEEPRLSSEPDPNLGLDLELLVNPLSKLLSVLFSELLPEFG